MNFRLYCLLDAYLYQYYIQTSRQTIIQHSPNVSHRVTRGESGGAYHDSKDCSADSANNLDAVNGYGTARLPG